MDVPKIVRKTGKEAQTGSNDSCKRFFSKNKIFINFDAVFAEINFI
jgi:hypothetical protein